MGQGANARRAIARGHMGRTRARAPRSTSAPVSRLGVERPLLCGLAHVPAPMDPPLTGSTYA
jgi:hypothetical protein